MPLVKKVWDAVRAHGSDDPQWPSDRLPAGEFPKDSRPMPRERVVSKSHATQTGLRGNEAKYLAVYRGVDRAVIK